MIEDIIYCLPYERGERVAIFVTNIPRFPFSSTKGKSTICFTHKNMRESRGIKVILQVRSSTLFPYLFFCTIFDIIIISVTTFFTYNLYKITIRGSSRKISKLLHRLKDAKGSLIVITIKDFSRSDKGLSCTIRGCISAFTIFNSVGICFCFI